ncbi:hypothetical protein AAHB43_06665 [Staphylococcus pseudintermedius]
MASAIGQNPLSIIVPCQSCLHEKMEQLGGFNSGFAS